MLYILILTIVGSTGQSGHAIHSMEFSSQRACENAKAAWLASYPRLAHDPKYYDEGTPRAICVPKN